MYNSTNVAKIIKKTAKVKNIQLKDMLLELKLSKDTLSNMYRGSMLKGDSLARIADYLDVSVDYLLGRTDEQTTRYINNSNVVQGNSSVAVTGSVFGSGSITAPMPTLTEKSKDLSKEETEILNIYRSLNIHDKSTFLNFILDMGKEKNT